MPVELDKLQQAILKQIKKDNPELSDKEAESRSWAVAQAQFKKMNKKESIEEKITSDGKIIVAENVKLYIGGNITYVGEVMEG